MSNHALSEPVPATLDLDIQRDDYRLDITMTLAVPQSAEPLYAFDGSLVGFTIGGKTYRPQVVLEEHDAVTDDFRDLSYADEVTAGFDRALDQAVSFVPA